MGVLDRLCALCDEYGADPTDSELVLEDRILEPIVRLKADANTYERDAAEKTAMDKLYVHLLALWQNRRIPGRETAELLEKKASRYDSLARLSQRKGADAQADKQLERAAQARARARELRSA